VHRSAKLGGLSRDDGGIRASSGGTRNSSGRRSARGTACGPSRSVPAGSRMPRSKIASARAATGLPHLVVDPCHTFVANGHQKFRHASMTGTLNGTAIQSDPFEDAADIFNPPLRLHRRATRGLPLSAHPRVRRAGRALPYPRACASANSRGGRACSARKCRFGRKVALRPHDLGGPERHRRLQGLPHRKRSASLAGFTRRAARSDSRTAVAPRSTRVPRQAPAEPGRVARA
jgi:hypothetical protein